MFNYSFFVLITYETVSYYSGSSYFSSAIISFFKLLAPIHSYLSLKKLALNLPINLFFSSSFFNKAYLLRLGKISLTLDLKSLLQLLIDYSISKYLNSPDSYDMISNVVRSTKRWKLNFYFSVFKSTSSTFNRIKLTMLIPLISSFSAFSKFSSCVSKFGIKI